MLTLERRRKILMKIGENRSVSVSELSGELGVSVVTIRKDLEVLEREGYVTRTFGGAVLNESEGEIITLKRENQDRNSEISPIIKEAAKLVNEGQTILLGQGSLILELVKFLCQNRRNLTIVTFSIEVALEAVKSPNIDVILTGGIVREKSMTLIGFLAERVLNEIRADLSFIEIDGINEQMELTTSNIIEMNTVLRLMENSNHPVVLAKSSVFERNASTKLMSINSKMTTITDYQIPERVVKSFEKSNFKLIVAQDSHQVLRGDKDEF